MKIKLIFLVIFPIILNAQSFDLVCKKNDNEITEKSLIKDTSPNTIEIITQDTALKSFIWDAQNLEMHFETLNDPNIKLKIGIIIVKCELLLSFIISDFSKYVIQSIHIFSI